jgi:hypothetical protein
MKKWLVLTLVLCVGIFTWQQLAIACPADGHGCQKTEGAKQTGEEAEQQAADKQANVKPDCDHPCDGHDSANNKPCPTKSLCDRKI